MASTLTCSPGALLSEEDCALLAKSFKDEKFRQLLCDYAKEVSDPENRKQYEKEVIQYEKERGVEALFVHPSPGFSLELKFDDGDSELDVPSFVNICGSEVVERPSVEPEIVKGGGKSCHRCSLPHAVTKPRREVLREREGGRSQRRSSAGSRSQARNKGSKRYRDLSKQSAVVYDVVFHPEALMLAEESPVMKQALIDTAMASLKQHYSVCNTGKVEHTEAQEGYIGVPAEAIIKRKVSEKNLSHPSESVKASAYKDHRTNSISDCKAEDDGDATKCDYIVPVYKLKHVSKMNIQDYSLQLVPQSASPAWYPQSLEVEVSLPGVARAAQVNANVWEQSVLLTTESTPKYKLELPLRYTVDEDLSSAKFDVSTQKLTLTLPVIASEDKNGSRPAGVTQGQSPPSDSGIECELDYRTNGDSDSVSEGSVSSQDDGTKSGSCEAEEDCVFDPPQPHTENQHQLTLSPAYTVRQTKDTLIITLCCGNVLPNSIKTHHDGASAWIGLSSHSSVGGGQTTVCYSLNIDVTPRQIGEAGLSHRVEEAEGKVVVEVKKAVAELWNSCRIGRGHNFTAVTLPPADDCDQEQQVSDKPKATSTEGKQDDFTNSAGPSPRTPRIMSRTVSMCETEASHPFRLRGPTCSWPRGILKHRTRSLSESQVSAFSTSATMECAARSSLDVGMLEDKGKYGEEEEEDEEEEEEGGESLASSYGEKKSVRFNDVVSRQLFRSNSSILGQRAKNQRKANRKQKSRARKDSESEKSDTGVTASESGESDLNTDAATDDDTDTTVINNSSKKEPRDDDEAAVKSVKDLQNKKTRNASKDNLNAALQSLVLDDSDNEICHLSLANKKSPGVVILSNKDMAKEDEDEDNTDFVIKTSKKKRRKNRKSKMPSLEPTNNLIFQMDMDK